MAADAILPLGIMIVNAFHAILRWQFHAPFPGLPVSAPQPLTSHEVRVSAEVVVVASLKVRTSQHDTYKNDQGQDGRSSATSLVLEASVTPTLFPLTQLLVDSASHR